MLQQNFQTVVRNKKEKYNNVLIHAHVFYLIFGCDLILCLLIAVWGHLSVNCKQIEGCVD